MSDEDKRDRGEFGFPAIGKDGDMFAPGKLHDISGPKIEFIDMITNIDSDGIHVSFNTMSGVQGYDVPATTDDAQYIMQILPDVLKQFLTKNTQYARAQAHDLGVKGTIPDINRKTSALITRFWDRDGLPMEGEDSNEELIGDLIGHLLLALAKMRST